MEPSQPPVSWAANKLPLLPQLASADQQRVQLHVQPLWVEAQQVLAQAMCPAQPRTTRPAQPDLTDASPPCRYPALQSAGTAPATSLAATATAAAARPPSAGCTCAGGFELQSRLLPGSWHRTPLRSTPAPRFCCTFPHQPTHPAVFLLHLSPINQSMNQSHVPRSLDSATLPLPCRSRAHLIVASPVPIRSILPSVFLPVSGPNFWHVCRHAPLLLALPCSCHSGVPLLLWLYIDSDAC